MNSTPIRALCLRTMHTSPVRPAIYQVVTLLWGVASIPAWSATTSTDLSSSTPLLPSAFGVPPQGSSNSPSTGNDNSAKTYGYSFTVTSQNLLVTDLGMFDSKYAFPTVGFYQDHRVGLWTAGGTLLGEVLISAGTGNALEGMFRYGSLNAPVLLESGGKYVLGAYYPAVSGFQIDGIVSSVHPLESATGFSLGTTQVRFGQGMAFPNIVAVNKPYVGPTLRFQTVPEPSSLLCLTTAISLIIMMRRRSFEGTGP